MYNFVKLCVFIYPIIPGIGPFKKTVRLSGRTEPATFSYQSRALPLRPTVSIEKPIQITVVVVVVVVVVVFIFVYVRLTAKVEVRH
jgi:hypothetical protein